MLKRRVRSSGGGAGRGGAGRGGWRRGGAGRGGWRRGGAVGGGAAGSRWRLAFAVPASSVPIPPAIHTTRHSEPASPAPLQAGPPGATPSRPPRRHSKPAPPAPLRSGPPRHSDPASRATPIRPRHSEPAGSVSVLTRKPAELPKSNRRPAVREVEHDMHARFPKPPTRSRVWEVEQVWSGASRFRGAPRGVAAGLGCAACC